jgi:hypothetical protein
MAKVTLAGKDAGVYVYRLSASHTTMALFFCLCVSCIGTTSEQSSAA